MQSVLLGGKLNNWAGVLLFGLIAASMALLLAWNINLGMGVIGFVVGLAVIIVCLMSTESAFYTNMACSFFVYHLSRLLFDGTDRGDIAKYVHQGYFAEDESQ